MVTLVAIGVTEEYGTGPFMVTVHRQNVTVPDHRLVTMEESYGPTPTPGTGLRGQTLLARYSPGSS